MSEYDKILKKHYNRAALEGWLKSALTGLAWGFGAAAVLSLLFYFLRVDLIWVCAVAGVAVAAIVTVIAYFVKNKPTLKSVAAKVDRAGLKERMITMIEYENDNSFMAEMQRKDAAKELEKMKNLRLKIKVRLASVLGRVFAFGNDYRYNRVEFFG